MKKTRSKSKKSHFPNSVSYDKQVIVVLPKKMPPPTGLGIDLSQVVNSKNRVFNQQSSTHSNKQLSTGRFHEGDTGENSNSKRQLQKVESISDYNTSPNAFKGLAAQSRTTQPTVNLIDRSQSSSIELHESISQKAEEEVRQAVMQAQQKQQSNRRKINTIRGSSQMVSKSKGSRARQSIKTNQQSRTDQIMSHRSNESKRSKTSQSKALEEGLQQGIYFQDPRPKGLKKQQFHQRNNLSKEELKQTLSDAKKKKFMSVRKYRKYGQPSIVQNTQSTLQQRNSSIGVDMPFEFINSTTQGQMTSTVIEEQVANKMDLIFGSTGKGNETVRTDPPQIESAQTVTVNQTMAQTTNQVTASQSVASQKSQQQEVTIPRIDLEKLGIKLSAEHQSRIKFKENTSKDLEYGMDQAKLAEENQQQWLPKLNAGKRLKSLKPLPDNVRKKHSSSVEPSKKFQTIDSQALPQYSLYPYIMHGRSPTRVTSLSNYRKKEKKLPTINKYLKTLNQAKHVFSNQDIRPRRSEAIPLNPLMLSSSQVSSSKKRKRLRNLTRHQASSKQCMSGPCLSPTPKEISIIQKNHVIEDLASSRPQREELMPLTNEHRKSTRRGDNSSRSNRKQRFSEGLSARKAREIVSNQKTKDIAFTQMEVRKQVDRAMGRINVLQRKLKSKERQLQLQDKVLFNSKKHSALEQERISQEILMNQAQMPNPQMLMLASNEGIPPPGLPVPQYSNYQTIQVPPPPSQEQGISTLNMGAMSHDSKSSKPTAQDDTNRQTSQPPQWNGLGGALAQTVDFRVETEGPVNDYSSRVQGVQGEENKPVGSLRLVTENSATYQNSLEPREELNPISTKQDTEPQSEIGPWKKAQTTVVSETMQEGQQQQQQEVPLIEQPRASEPANIQIPQVQQAYNPAPNVVMPNPNLHVSRTLSTISNPISAMNQTNIGGFSSKLGGLSKQNQSASLFGQNGQALAQYNTIRNTSWNQNVLNPNPFYRPTILHPSTSRILDHHHISPKEILSNRSMSSRRGGSKSPKSFILASRREEKRQDELRRSARRQREELRTSVILRQSQSALERQAKAQNLKAESEERQKAILKANYIQIKKNMKRRNEIKFYEEVTKRKRIEEFQLRKSDQVASFKAKIVADQVKNIDSNKKVLKQAQKMERRLEKQIDMSTQLQMARDRILGHPFV